MHKTRLCQFDFKVKTNVTKFTDHYIYRSAFCHCVLWLMKIPSANGNRSYYTIHWYKLWMLQNHVMWLPAEMGFCIDGSLLYAIAVWTSSALSCQSGLTYHPLICIKKLHKNWRDGQAELIWMADYTLRCFPSNGRSPITLVCYNLPGLT